MKWKTNKQNLIKNVSTYIYIYQNLKQSKDIILPPLQLSNFLVL